MAAPLFLLLASLTPSGAEVSAPPPVREGLYFSLTPQAVALGGATSVSRGDVSQSGGLVGAGGGLELGLGWALSPGLALAWQGAFILAWADTTRDFPFNEVTGYSELSTGVALHSFWGDLRLSGAAGLQVGLLSGGGADINSPDNLLQVGAALGPYAYGRVGWCLTENFELGASLQAAYLIDGQQQLPMARLSLGVSWLLF
ncbi:MAG: hypothetical protein IPG45_13005 [Deltaproteobacteria bacterium]|nr:hypothetical protein [Deltaproteobacteria bacterium]